MSRPWTLDRRVLGVSKGTGLSISGTAGVWTDVSGAIDLSDTVNGGDAFGVAGMCEDPSRPNVAYVGGARQGIWRTFDFGLTWSRCPNTGAGTPMDGHAWSIAIPKTGDYILANNGYGSAVGCYRSADNGDTWTLVIGGDINYLSISDFDPYHVLALSHGPDNETGKWWESFNGGRSWTDLGGQDPGIYGDGAFLADDVYITQTPLGLFTGVKTNGAWVWTLNAVELTGPHGGTRMFVDHAYGYFYVGGQEAGGRGRIYRCTLADRGQNFDLVCDIAGSGNFGPTTIFASQTKIYAQGNYATHDPYGPISHVADRANAGSGQWSNFSLDAAMDNGAHRAVVLTDGSKHVLLCANENAGIWRWVE